MAQSPNICSNPKKFPCPALDCKYNGDNGFARKDKLTSHWKKVHQTVASTSASSSKAPRAIQPASSIAFEAGNGGRPSTQGYEAEQYISMGGNPMIRILDSVVEARSVSIPKNDIVQRHGIKRTFTEHERAEISQKRKLHSVCSECQCNKKRVSGLRALRFYRRDD